MRIVGWRFSEMSLAGAARGLFQRTMITAASLHRGLLVTAAACTWSSRDLQPPHPSNFVHSKNLTSSVRRSATTEFSRRISNHHASVSEGDVASGNGEGSRRSLYFPRRAVMYVPACDERKVAKTTTISVDSLIFDIEDGVAVNQKDVARKAIGAAIATSHRDDSSSSLSEHVVRVNGSGSGLMNLDLREVFRSCDSHGVSPDAIMLPKVESVEQVAELDLCLSYHRPSLPPLPLYVMTESPLGLLHLHDICHFTSHSTRHLRLCAVVFGSDDYLASIGGVRSGGGSELELARQTVVGVACCHGVSAIDMVFTDFHNLKALRQEAEEGARMGFTGKQVIHPSQVELVEEAFSPSQERVQWATGLITAFKHHQQSGQGAFVYQGHMIDRPLLLQAQNILNLYANILRKEL